MTHSNSKNTAYYDYMRRQDRANYKHTNRVHKIKKHSKSFGAQKINLKNLSLAPYGWEGIFYTAYFIFIPYIVGNTFLFFIIAGSRYNNFMLLDTSSFFIIWAIGYEIVATITLTFIFFSYLKYDPEEKEF